MYRKLALSIAALALGVVAAWPAWAEGVVKIGVLEAMTGPQQTTGRQTLAAMRLYMQQHGDTVAGKKI
ncbi:MAG: ABC transporter substrate-binding protein, partial [Rhodoplanes sp.]